MTSRNACRKPLWVKSLRPPVAEGDPFELVGQHVELAGQRHLEDQELLLTRDLAVRSEVADPLVVAG